ncbi:MAG: hypothetical protein ACKVPX_02475 [Myxococcaceae bacterium]
MHVILDHCAYAEAGSKALACILSASATSQTAQSNNDDRFV